MLRKFFFILPFLALAACSSDSTSSGSSAQVQALNRTSTALSSLYSANDSFALSSRAQATDSICDSNGSPTEAGNNYTWAFNKFLCAGAHNTYSPDSALGALSLAKGIVCTADRFGLGYTTSGSTTSVSNAAFSTACFPQEMITKFAGDSITSITADITGFTMDEATGWDYRIELRNSPAISNFDLYIRNSGNVIAAAMVNTTDNDGWTITIDRRATTNYLIYEAANTNTHMRIMAEGEIAASGTVGEVSNMAGIIANSGTAPQDYVALRGNDAGLQMGWQKGGAQTAASCIRLSDGGAGTCTESAISFLTTDTEDFTDTATTITNSLALFDNNPISMTVSGFIQTDEATAAFGSNLR